MKRSEIRENIFKLVFCGEFHTSSELENQLNAYLEDVECTDQERSYIAAKFEGICEKITEIDEAISRFRPPATWPFAAQWWKPVSRRRSLVKAAALILAEIERLDRAEGQSNG